MMFHVKLKFMICTVSSPGTGRKAAEEDCLSFLTILLLTIKPTVNFNILNHKYFLFSYTVTLPTVHTYTVAIPRFDYLGGLFRFCLIWKEKEPKRSSFGRLKFHIGVNVFYLLPFLDTLCCMCVFIYSFPPPPIL